MVTCGGCDSNVRGGNGDSVKAGIAGKVVVVLRYNPRRSPCLICSIFAVFEQA